MTPSRGLEPGAHADVNGPASSLTQTGWPASRDETVFDRDETRLKPTSGALVFGQIAVDHAGHHHQPLLSAVLQGGIVRHSDAAPDLGLSFRTQKKRAEADAALLGLAGALAWRIARSVARPETA